MSEIFLYVIGGLMFYQAYITVRVMRHKPYSAAQKRRHYLFIRLILFFGAAMALAGLSADKASPP